MMTQPLALQTRYDTAAILASGLCLVHCLVLPALLFMLPVLAVWLTLPESFHFWMLALAVPASLIALYLGLRRHSSWMPIMIASPAMMALSAGALLFHGTPLETWLTVAGALALTVAHHLNRRFACAVAG